MGQRHRVVEIDKCIDARERPAGEHVLHQPLDRAPVTRLPDAEALVSGAPGRNAGNLRELGGCPLRACRRFAFLAGSSSGRLQRLARRAALRFGSQRRVMPRGKLNVEEEEDRAQQSRGQRHDRAADARGAGAHRSELPPRERFGVKLLLGALSAVEPPRAFSRKRPLKPVRFR